MGRKAQEAVAERRVATEKRDMRPLGALWRTEGVRLLSQLMQYSECALRDYIIRGCGEDRFHR
jgi:hypothetical protein